MTYLAAGEQNGTHRRGDGANAEIHADHDAELNGVHPEGLADGQEDGSEDQHCRGWVHKGAHDEQDDVHQDQNDILVAGEGQDAVGNEIGQTGESHDPRHDGGQTDHQGDDAGHLSGFQNDAGQIFQSEALVNQAQNGSVSHSHGRSLGCGEHTAQNTANDDDDEQQAGNGIQNGLQRLLAGNALFDDIALFLCCDTCDHHDDNTPQDAGKITCREQSSHGNAACNGGVDDHQVRRRNQHSGGSGGNVDGSTVYRIITFFFLHGADGAAHGGSSGSTGTGDGTEQHIGDDVGLGQCTRHPACNGFCHIHKALCNAAVVHQVARQNEEGNGD